MRLADWFRPRIDGTLHWQQALAIMIATMIVIGPVNFWWRYEGGPRATANEAVTGAFGQQSDFRVTRILNQLEGHPDLFPHRTGADTLVCGTAVIEGERVPIGMLARTRHRGRLVDVVLFRSGLTKNWRYPDAGPQVVDLCERQAPAGSSPCPPTACAGMSGIP